MEGIINTVVYGSVSLVVLFLLMNTVVLSHFNTTYNTTVDNLSSSTLQGLFLLMLVLALIGMALGYIKTDKND
jgi:hypothetical protein